MMPLPDERDDRKAQVVALRPSQLNPAIDVQSAEDGVLSLYEREYAGLVRLGTLLVDDRHVAEDLVHEAFLRIYRSWHRIDDPSRALPYLRATLVNLTRSRYRRGLLDGRRTMDRAVHEPSSEDHAMRTDRRQQVVSAVQALPRRQRECIVLRHYLDMSESEIAATLGVSVGSVRTHTKRAMTALQGRLEDIR